MTRPADGALHAMAGAAPAGVTPVALAARILDNDEIIELSLKPSLWFIPGSAARYLAGLLLLAIGFGYVGSGMEVGLRNTIFNALLLATVATLGLTALHWASRVYILTNRRAMCIAGVLSVKVRECPLARAASADLRQNGLERTMRLGTIDVRSADDSAATVEWTFVARPQEVHEKLLRAIQRSRMDR